MLQKRIFNPYKQKGLECWVFVPFNALGIESRIMHVCFDTKQTQHNEMQIRWIFHLTCQKYMCCLKAQLHQQ